VTRLRSVADTEDKIGKGETDLPVREMLADMLMDMQKPQEALVEYEISLRTDPNRFNGLYGAAQAAEMTHQKDKATAYYAQLLKNCNGTMSDRPELAQAKTLLAAK
jgi:predicted Zn-dependent protease